MVRLSLRFLFVIAALAMAVPASALAAQDATPTSAQPGPNCGVTPQPLEDLINLAFPQGTPAALSAEPVVAMAESDLPVGELADAAMSAAADQVVQSWLVCLLAGDEPRLFALMTDDLDANFIQHYASLAIGDTPAKLRALLQSTLGGTLIAASTAALAPTGRDIRVLDDGRIGGIWNIEGDDSFVILAEQDGTWLLDEIIDIIDE